MCCFASGKNRSIFFNFGVPITSFSDVILQNQDETSEWKPSQSKQTPSLNNKSLWQCTFQSVIRDRFQVLKSVHIHHPFVWISIKRSRKLYLGKKNTKKRSPLSVNAHIVCIRGRHTGGNAEWQAWMSTALEDWLNLLFSCIKQIQFQQAENYLLQLMYCNCSGHIHKEGNL